MNHVYKIKDNLTGKYHKKASCSKRAWVPYGGEIYTKGMIDSIFGNKGRETVNGVCLSNLIVVKYKTEKIDDVNIRDFLNE